VSFGFSRKAGQNLSAGLILKRPTRALSFLYLFNSKKEKALCQVYLNV